MVFPITSRPFYPHNTPHDRLRPFYKKTKGRDSFDHIIYIADAMILAPPTRYTSMMQGLKSNALNDTLKHMGMFGYQNISKVEINGDFPNQDYLAIPYQ